MNPFKSIVFDALLFSWIVAFAGEPATPPSAKADEKAVQGTWKVVALEAEGTKAPAEIVAAMKLVFKDTTLTFVPGEPGYTNYTFKLDPTVKPATFDMTPADGKGDAQKGIYLLKGDSLKICFGTTERPKEFPKDGQPPAAIYTLKRLEGVK